MEKVIFSLFFVTLAIVIVKKGILTDGEGSAQLTSSFR
jgi:hypothetical protein